MSVTFSMRIGESDQLQNDGAILFSKFVSTPPYKEERSGIARDLVCFAVGATKSDIKNVGLLIEVASLALTESGSNSLLKHVPFLMDAVKGALADKSIEGSAEFYHLKALSESYENRYNLTLLFDACRASAANNYYADQADKKANGLVGPNKTHAYYRTAFACREEALEADDAARDQDPNHSVRENLEKARLAYEQRAFDELNPEVSALDKMRAHRINQGICTDVDGLANYSKTANVVLGVIGNNKMLTYYVATNNIGVNYNVKIEPGEKPFYPEFDVFPEGTGIWGDALIREIAKGPISPYGEAAIIVGNAEMEDFEPVAE